MYDVPYAVQKYFCRISFREIVAAATTESLNAGPNIFTDCVALTRNQPAY